MDDNTVDTMKQAAKENKKDGFVRPFSSRLYWDDNSGTIGGTYAAISAKNAQAAAPTTTGNNKTDQPTL